MDEFDRNLAIVIGINDYQNGIDKLQTAVLDAVAIAEILQKTYNYKLIHPDFASGVIVNQYATKEKLETLLTDFLPNKIKPTKSDRLIFYFAGHGIARNSDDEPQGFLVPQDADMKQQDSLLRMSDVHDWLAKLECKHLLVILDCCFAGAFRWASYRTLIPITPEITKAHYDRFIRFPAWQVLTSASHNQEALEFLNNRDIESNKNHSPFAAGLIEALQQGEGDINKDGVIIATELYQYLRDYVEDDSKDRQTPGFFPLKKHDRGEYLFKLPDTPLNLKETPELNKDNNPYRGLEPFEAKHSKLFFGRDEVIEQLYTTVVNLAQLNNQLTIVTGISGSGKSSLVKAGLIPYLQNKKHNKWQIFDPIRPGTNPYAALGRILSQIDRNVFRRTGDTTLIGKQLQDNSSKFVKAINAWSKQNPDSRLLLVIDQFEELITMTPKDKPADKTVKQNWLQKLRKKLGLAESEPEPDKSSDETEKWTEFIELLVEILDRCPQLSLIVTLRSDFEPRFQESAFGAGWSDARFVVRPMRSDELREAVEKPAAEKALYFEPPELVDRLVDEVSQMPGALPLLSFTLSEMYIQLYEDWKNEGKSDRALTVTEDFEQKGGVAGALTRRANEEFRNLPSPKKAHRLTMQRVMLRMVELEGGEAVRRRVLKSELTYPSDEENERVETVLARLQQARLIFTGTDAEADEPYYEPAHDYLVRGWERLQVWITKEQDGLALQELLTPAAKAWKAENKDLWDNNSRLDRLKEIQNKDTSDDNWLNAIESEFVEQSHKIKRKKQRNFRNGSIAIISTLTVLSVAAISFGLQSNRREKIAFARQLAVTSEFIRSQKDNLHETSVLLALEAYKRSYEIHKPNRPSSAVNSALYNGLGLLPDHLFGAVSHQSRVMETELSSDSQYLATRSSDGIAKLVELSTGKETIISHQDAVSAIEFSGDSQYLAIGSEDGIAKLVELSTGKETIISHQGAVSAIEFSRDSQYLAIGSEDGIAKLVELSTGEEKVISHQGAVSAIEFSGDSQYFVTGSNDGITKLVELSTGKETVISHQDEIWEIEFSDDSKYLATGSWDGTAKLVELITGKETVIFHQEVVRAIEFSGDSKYLATVSYDGTAKLVELSTGKETVISHQDEIWEIEFSDDSKYLATGSRDGTARLVELSTEKETVISHQSAVDKIEFSGDNQYLAIGSYDGATKLVELSTEKEAVISHQGFVRVMEFSGDSQYLVTGSDDETAKVVQLSTDQETSISHKDDVWEIEFSDDSQYFATRSNDNTAKLVELNTGEKTIISHQDAVRVIRFSDDSQYFATGSNDNTAKLVQLNTGEKTIISHQDDVWEVEFSDDSQYFATGSNDNTAKLVQLNTGKETVISHQDAVRAIEFSGDSQYLATGSWDGTAKVIELKTGKETVISHQDRVRAIEFSDDSQYLATGSNDGVTKLVQLSTGKETIISHHQGEVWKIEFSRDSQYIATRSSDGTTKLVQLSTGKETIISHQDAASAIEFSDDSQYIATKVHDRQARVIELNTGKEKVISHQDRVAEIKFSGDSQYLATISGDVTVKIIELKTGKEKVISHQDRVEKIEFSDNNQYLATGSWDGTAKVIELNTGKETVISHQDRVEKIEFSDNNQYLATGSYDETTKLVELSTGRETVIPHQDRVEEIEFSGDNQYLATSAKNNVRLTLLNAEKLISLTCNRLSQNLDLISWQRYFNDEPYRKTCNNLPLHPSFLREGKKLSEAGKIKEAVSYFKQVQKLDAELKINTEAWNSLCRNGSFNRQAKKVMFACDKAIETTSESDIINYANYRDSRGLALAQIGKSKQAVEDFKLFINYSQADEESIARRKVWIEALKKGDNPFTNEVLEELKNE